MRKSEIEDTVARYNKRLQEFGYSPKTLGWTSGKQEIRFRILSEIGELNNSSILDVGCGFGDLFGYLVSKGHKIKYTGIDINKNLIDIGSKLYPSAHFIVDDFASIRLEQQSYDWIVASGPFNFRLTDNYRFISKTLKKMFRYSIKGIAADFLSSYSDYQNPDAFHCNPEILFHFCKTKLSRRVALRHDYMPYEFCIYIYKNDEINNRNAFSAFDTS